MSGVMFLSPSHLTHLGTFVAPLRFTDPTGLSAECATAHCETVEVSADAPHTYVDTSATHHGNVCGMPLTEDIEFAINPDGTCYTWFYKPGYMFISGRAGPVPSTQTGPAASPPPEEREDPAQTDPPCGDPMCEVLRGVDEKAGGLANPWNYAKFYAWSATGLQWWGGLVACGIFGCSAGEAAVAVLPFTPNQAALVALAKGAKKAGGVTMEEARILREWADEVGLPSRGPEMHPDRNFKDLHIHVGPVNHVPVRPR
jgi:hypothetical protein